jgi:hypothetical protein
MMPYPKGGKTFVFDTSGIYRIRVLGFLDESWSERLGGLRITESSRIDQKDPVTELVGKVRDQAELSGVLNALYELHLPLVSVEILESEKHVTEEDQS